MGMMHRSPIPRVSKTCAENLLDLVHTNVAGPPLTPSKGGARYFVTFIDDNSGWVTVFPIKSKSDCFLLLPAVPYDSRNTNGAEDKRNKIKSFLTSNGIHHQQTCAYTQQ